MSRLPYELNPKFALSSLCLVLPLPCSSQFHQPTCCWKWGGEPVFYCCSESQGLQPLACAAPIFAALSLRVVRFWSEMIFLFLIWIFPQVGMTMSEQHFRVWGKAAAGRGEVLEPWALDDLRATWPRLTAQDHHERRDCNFIFFLFQSFVENLVIFWTLEITQNAWKAFFRHASTLVLQGGWLWYGGNDDDDVSTRCKVWTTSEGVKVWKCKVWMTIEGVKVWKCKVQSMNENDQRGF